MARLTSTRIDDDRLLWLVQARLAECAMLMWPKVASLPIWWPSPINGGKDDLPGD